MLQKLKKRIKSLLKPDIRARVTKIPGRLEKLGTKYGGWIIPVSMINKDSVCYLAGAGEDISFDVALANRFQCTIHIFDPTPRSRLHFEKVSEAISKGKPAKPETDANYVYELDKRALPHLHFHETGIWTRNETLRFFAPKDETHISHSIGNLQGTENYFEARVQRVSDIMNEQGHTLLHILKLDIEGAEYEVIDSLLADKLPVKILCVEFHPSKENGLQPARDMVRKLEQNNYKLVAREELDFTFINFDLYRQGDK